MQKYFPEDAYFARLNEAILLAVSSAVNYDELKYDNGNEYGKCMCMPT